MARLTVGSAVLLVGLVLPGCVPDQPGSPSAGGVTVTGLSGFPLVVAEETGAYLAITGRYRQDQTLDQKVIYSEGGNVKPITLMTSSEERTLSLMEVSISPDGLTGAIVSRECLTHCDSYPFPYRISLRLLDLRTQRLIGLRSFDWPIPGYGQAPGQPVNQVRISDGGKLVVWNSPGDGEEVWRPESNELSHVARLTPNVGTNVLQACSDGESYIASDANGNAVRVRIASGAGPFAVEPQPFFSPTSQGWSFTSDCSQAWAGGGFEPWAVQILDATSVRSIDFRPYFEGARLLTAALSDDLATAVVAVVNPLHLDRLEYWRVSVSNPADHSLLGWTLNSEWSEPTGGWTSGGGYPLGGTIGNGGNFALRVHDVTGQGIFGVVAGGPASNADSCSGVSSLEETPELTRNTEFVVADVSPISLTTFSPVPAAACRTRLEIAAYRVSPDPTIGGRHDMAGDQGFLFEDLRLQPSSFQFASQGGGFAIATLAAGTLPPGLYDFVAVRSRADGTSTVASKSVRVKVVSSWLKLLDSAAKARMRAAGGKWIDVASDERQFTDFVDAGTSSEITEVFGDLDTATDVGVQISGFNETADARYSVSATGQVSSGQGAWNSERIWIDSGRRTKYGTAVVAWHGYDAPVENVGSDAAAFHGASNLAADLDTLGLGAGRTQRLTLVGHSYGSLVASLAVMKEDVHPDNLIVMGSPGLDIERYAQDGVPGIKYYQSSTVSGVRYLYDHGVDALVNIPPEHVWVGRGPGDPVAGLEEFGVAPHLTEFGANEYDTDAHSNLGGYECSVLDGVFDCHSHYFDLGTTSLYNITLIIQGHGDPDFPGPGEVPFVRNHWYGAGY